MINWKKLRKLIPAKVQITKKVHYEIVWTKDFVNGTNLGETRYEFSQIVLKEDTNNKELIHTYLHELLHAISAEYDADLTEVQVQALEKAVYYILKENNIFNKDIKK